MHGLNLGGRAIIPLRAVPNMSGGDISPLTIALAAGDPRTDLGERTYATRLPVSRLTPEGRAYAEPLGALGRVLETVGQLVQDGTSITEQILALPSSPGRVTSLDRRARGMRLSANSATN